MAFVFQQSQGSENVVLGVIQHVGTLKQILKLDDGPMSSPIVLFCYNCVKNETNNRDNRTYKRIVASFLLANFDICCLNSMNPLFSLHKFSMYFFGMNPRHRYGHRKHYGSMNFIENLDAKKL
jgi:hypothetical protein